MPASRKKAKAVPTQRQVVENAIKVASELYYAVYAKGNQETRDHVVVTLAAKLNPEGVATAKWKAVCVGHLLVESK